jgi:hypothetical protein
MGGARTLKFAEGLTTPDRKNWNVMTRYTGPRAWMIILKGPLKRDRMKLDGLDSFGSAHRQAARTCHKISDSIRKGIWRIS